MAYILGEENGNAEEANNSGILQIPNHKTNNQMYISSNSSVYEFVDFTTNSNNTNALEEKEGLQPRLSSTMKISC